MFRRFGHEFGHTRRTHPRYAGTPQNPPVKISTTCDCYSAHVRAKIYGIWPVISRIQGDGPGQAQARGRARPPWGGHADRRADFVTLAKENRVFRMGRFAWPFRRGKGPLLYFCRWCPTICARRGRFYKLFGQGGRVSFALSLGKNMCHGSGLRFRPRTHIYASRLEETAWYHF